MGDPDRHVRKAAVVALSAVVHHKPGLVAGGLAQLLPLLFEQTVIREDMVRAGLGWAAVESSLVFLGGLCCASCACAAVAHAAQRGQICLRSSV
jgi:hypothetical protein